MYVNAGDFLLQSCTESMYKSTGDQKCNSPFFFTYPVSVQPGQNSPVKGVYQKEGSAACDGNIRTISLTYYPGIYIAHSE